MATKLQRLLAAIDPDRTLEEVDRRVDEALNSFSLPAAKIDRWDAFRACLIDLLHHTQRHVLRMSRPCPMGVDFDWGRCCRVLHRIYGANGEKTAFELARTGNEGGLYAVARKMARQIAENAAETEIAAMVHSFWNFLSVDERLQAGEEYLRDYGHLLPSELTEGSAARVRANLPKFLIEHPRTLRRLRRTRRTGNSARAPPR